MSLTFLHFSQKHSKSSQLAIVQRCTLPLGVMNSISAKYPFIPEVCTTVKKSKFFHLNQSCNLIFEKKNSFILQGFSLQREVPMKTSSGSQNPSPSSPKPRNCSWYTEVLSCSYICVRMDRFDWALSVFLSHLRFAFKDTTCMSRWKIQMINRWFSAS